MKSSAPTPPLALVLACVFISGACALIYQSVWLREFRLFFGASTAATAAVTAIFMGGLGVGSFCLGRRTDQWSNPMGAYAKFECGIALGAAATPLLLGLARSLYLALGGTTSLGLWGGTGVRLLLATVVLAGPAVLMGGTLPAVASAVRMHEDGARRRVGWLYAANTFGAVAGTMLSTFVLLEHLGNRLTLWTAAALNLLIALAALRLARGAAVVPGSRRTEHRGGAKGDSAIPVEPPPGRVEFPFVPVACAVAGFAFFLLELVWYRMLGPLLGGSSYSFGLVLALALSGIACGSLLYARREDRPPTLSGFAMVCALEALCVALPYALGDRVALLALTMDAVGNLGFAARTGQWTVVAGLVIFPAALVAGYQFPMLIGLLGRGPHAIGTHTGMALAWNTAGAMAGSIAGGFGLLPLLSAPGLWRLVIVLLAGLSVVAMVLSGWSLRAWRSWGVATTTGAVALLLLTTTGPTAAWRHSPIGAGRARVNGASANAFEGFLRDRRRPLVWEAEGVESSLALIADRDLAFLVNGRADGSARGDAATQVMLGVLGALMHPNPRAGFVVGLGTGATAGWLADVRSMERVDVVELEPKVMDVAAACAPVNRNALANPKLHVRFGDAREVMLTTRQTYDVIASEPSNPFRAGVSSLYTVEFYRAVASRLRAGGLFLQWVQAYEVDGETVSVIYATMASVFPTVDTWKTESGDLFFVASQDPLVYDLARVRGRLAEEPFRSALLVPWQVFDVEGVFAHFVAENGLARAVVTKGVPANTDDRNLLEFALARAVGRETDFSVGTLLRVALEEGYSQPRVANGALDLVTLADRRVSLGLMEHVSNISLQTSHAGLQARTAAKIAWTRGDWPVVLKHWRSQTNEPGDLVELTMLAQAAAATADPDAPRFLERLRERRLADAETLGVQHLAARGRRAEAIEQFERSLTVWREDPWVSMKVMEDTLALARQWTRDTVGSAGLTRVFQALEEPFAARVVERDRIRSRLDVARNLDRPGFTDLTRQALAAYEPNPPWQREVLTLRVHCYEALRDPRADLARRELARHARRDERPFQFSARAELTPAVSNSASLLPGVATRLAATPHHRAPE